MVCATGCNPDSGKYLELPPGEVGLMRICEPYAQELYDKCKDVASEGTDKCCNGPKQLPEIDACCDPLPTTPECTLAKLNVTSFPQFVPFIGRTIADPTCPTAQSRTSAADSAAVGSPPSPPSKSAQCTSLVSGMVGFGLFALAAAASSTLLM
ncbi:unnamed protein product [Closterium sp. NIES-64]|nr:unnamed protein product [Closterium sp. NIES-64]